MLSFSEHDIVCIIIGITVGATLAMLTLFATLVVVGACVVRYTMKRRVVSFK